MATKTIHLYNAANKEIHTTPVKSKARRYTMEVAATRKQLNALKATFPETDRATITFPWKNPDTDKVEESIQYFEFVNGDCRIYIPKEENPDRLYRSSQGR